MGESTRLAELVGGLALACDLVNAFPPEKVLRTAILAVEIGRRAGVTDEKLRDAYYVSLLRFLGCTGFAHEEAHVYGAGDDRGTRNVMAFADATNPVGTIGAIVANVGAGGAPRDRARAIANLLLDRDAVTKHSRAQCDTSLRFAEILGMSTQVREAVAHVCERWDGKGAPAKLTGEALDEATRLLHVADVVELAHHRMGREAAVAEAERRMGKHLDPRFAAAFLADAEGLFATIEGATVWERFLAAEPTPHAVVDEARLDDVGRVFALFGDLKSVFTLGHSMGVAALAKAAAEAAGLDGAAARDLHHAALLHDIGRVAVPNGIWDKPGALGIAEWERVRLHAYYTERIVLRAPPWSRAARIACAAHERLDASGYHRGVPQSLIARAERLLAAADAFHAMREPRPHRPALALDAAKDELLRDVKSARLDADAVDAVLAAAGLAARRAKATWPRGLSDREVEVLRLVARGKSNKEIGILLDISARTVQNHVAHVYDKIGVYSRAGAALFVTENALLDD